MTAPLMPLLWATFAPTGTGFGFARITKTNAETSGHKVMLPVGVNMVTFDWSGSSKVILQAGPDGAMRRFEIPAGKSGESRQVTFRLPVDTSAALHVTVVSSSASEVGQPLGGLLVFPSEIGA